MGLEALPFCRGTQQPRNPSKFLTAICVWGISLFCISASSTSLKVLLLYILSYMTYVQLDFRQFSMMVVL